jgi:C4-type Zn-finger protein
MAALEERVSILEAAKPALPPPAAVDPAKACPMCGAEMKITSEVGHPQFSFAGVKIHTMSCPSCNFKTNGDFRPGKGYS